MSAELRALSDRPSVPLAKRIGAMETEIRSHLAITKPGRKADMLRALAAHLAACAAEEGARQ